MFAGRFTFLCFGRSEDESASDACTKRRQAYQLQRGPVVVHVQYVGSTWLWSRVSQWFERLGACFCATTRLPQAPQEARSKPTCSPRCCCVLASRPPHCRPHLKRCVPALTAPAALLSSRLRALTLLFSLAEVFSLCVSCGSVDGGKKASLNKLGRDCC